MLIDQPTSKLCSQMVSCRCCGSYGAMYREIRRKCHVKATLELSGIILFPKFILQRGNILGSSEGVVRITSEWKSLTDDNEFFCWIMHSMDFVKLSCTTCTRFNYILILAKKKFCNGFTLKWTNRWI